MRECGKIWYSQIEHRRQYNKAHALCILDNWGYRHTFRICNTYCFSMVITVTRTLPIVALYIYCLYCLFWLLSNPKCCIELHKRSTLFYLLAWLQMNKTTSYGEWDRLYCNLVTKILALIMRYNLITVVNGLYFYTLKSSLHDFPKVNLSQHIAPTHSTCYEWAFHVQIAKILAGVLPKA